MEKKRLKIEFNKQQQQKKKKKKKKDNSKIEYFVDSWKDLKIYPMDLWPIAKKFATGSNHYQLLAISMAEKVVDLISSRKSIFFFSFFFFSPFSLILDSYSG